MSELVQLSQLLENHASDILVDADEVWKAQKQSNYSPTLIVLDDDPTGTQSVAELPVITSWTLEALKWALEQGAPAVYVMTNSRSLSPKDAERVNREVVSSTQHAASELGCDVAFVSRSDSTLRGHFPLEPQVLADCSEDEIDGIIVIPAFGDAGRITVDAVHYAGDSEDGFLPVGKSEFAKDSTFGYRSSDLREWIEEKTGEATRAMDVTYVDLDTLRTNPERTIDLLLQANNRNYIISDIVTEDDLRLLSLAVIKAEAQGKRFIYRVGPPAVRARIGQQPPQVVSAGSTTPSHATQGGLVVVGSHVPTTTRQLNHLMGKRNPTVVEIDAERVLVNEDGYLPSLADEVIAGLGEGSVVLHTSRKLIEGHDEQDSLRIARDISAAVVDVVKRVVHTVTPRFVIAKGGITSSDVASKGLEMTRAKVIGPMEPGIISMWQALDGPAAGVPYVVFAGNVGTDQSLAHVVDVLSQ